MTGTVAEVTLQGGSYDVSLDVEDETLKARVPVGGAAGGHRSQRRSQWALIGRERACWGLPFRDGVGIACGNDAPGSV